MQEKARFIEKIKGQIAEWDAKLDAMKAEASKSSRARIESLKLKRDALAEKLSLLADAAPEAWNDFKRGVENAWDELRRAIDDEKKPNRPKGEDES